MKQVSTGKKGVWAKVISFDLGAKGSIKVKFYHKLFGFYTTKRRGNKTYRYFVPGLLSKIPHLRLGKSVVAVPPEASEEVCSFLSNPAWKPIQVHVVDALLSPEQQAEAVKRALETPVRLVAGEVSLKEAVEMVSRRGSKNSDYRYLLSLLSQLEKFEWLKDEVAKLRDSLIGGSHHR
jgi:hypothetical protein